MIHQYRPQRRKGGHNPHGIGTVPVGTIARFRQARRLGLTGPWIVESWLNREYSKHVAGRFHTVYIVGGHLAVIRSLRTGERRRVSDWHILFAVDND